MALTSIAPVINQYGVTVSTYSEIVEHLKEKYREIYGQDVYLENDSQDGQWIGVIARVVADCNAAVADVYSSMSPSTADTDALSRNVKINGIRRAVSTKSSVSVVLVGVAGTIINNGIVSDKNNNRWLLPAQVVIPPEGEIVTTATAEKPGAILALPNSVTTISKPMRGWYSVNNPQASTLGAPVESNTKLRQRQALSTAIPSRSYTEGILGALFSLDGVSRCKVYENKKSFVDPLGLPPNSLAVVVAGGDDQLIAETIRVKKAPGCDLYGNTTVVRPTVYGDPVEIQYWRPNQVIVGLKLNLRTTTDYTVDIGEQVKYAIADYVNQLDIGDRISLNKLYVPAGLYGALEARTYELDSIELIINGSPKIGDYTLAFNEVAFCDSDDIEISVTGGA
ncbi:baseplate J/gp47 family protein [Acinetobacter baumannii]|uniref:baseplate J/gp47 family protein n=1 Tax=Acinetobacter baumannii TaxID=470 RepID=UPI0027413655|nr:baseplate J/gp47 family protein [Acinetobacter baumannii]MDP7840851.1 baseplate J/gp47 family protein [Acinetobacter baumannii]MDP7863524.1 baseplate J/gp47 family protein [Acinetobacter baumannii]